MAHKAAAYLSALLAMTGTPILAQSSMPELNGTWESVACELRPQAGQDGVSPWYLTRRVAFREGHIEAHFTTFADPHCKMPMLELKFGGDVVVQGPSSVARDAQEVDLIVNDYLTVTPQMEGFAEFLNTADRGTCGQDTWKVGTEQDVFATGCSVMGVAANTPTNEYEVLYVSAGHLYFGARPIDGASLDQPDARPTALQMPLKRRDGGKTQRVGADDLRVPRHVEIVHFEQADDVDPAEVRAFFEQISEKMNQNGTLLYRTVGHGADGSWICVNYWTSRPDMETLNAQAQSWTEEFSAMAKLVKPRSFRLTSYDTGL